MWIAFTLLAAWFQSMRAINQKILSVQENALHTTLSRSLFSLPLVILYSVICWYLFGSIHLPDSSLFYIIAAIAAIIQIHATYLMLILLKKTGVNSGTVIAKTEALLTAILGSAFLSDKILSFNAWLAIIIGMIGLFLLSMRKDNIIKTTTTKRIACQSNILRFACGLCFAISSVSVCYASGELEGSFLTRAAFTLTYFLFIQSFFLWAIQAYQTKHFCYPFKNAFPLNCKVGFYSAMGSIGWFTAYTLANPALVKTLGQIGVIKELYYSKMHTKKRLNKKEKVGIALILMGAVGAILFI